MRPSRTLLVVAALASAACSTTTSTPSSASGASTAKPSSTVAAKPHDDHEEHGGHHEHGDLSEPLTAFHDVLAPLWHSKKGADRPGATCAATADLHDRALAVDKAGPPANAAQPDAFRERAKKLVVTVDELGAECLKDGRPDFEAKFASVHDAFHGVMESSAPK